MKIKINVPFLYADQLTQIVDEIMARENPTEELTIINATIDIQLGMYDDDTEEFSEVETGRYIDGKNNEKIFCSNDYEVHCNNNKMIYKKIKKVIV